MEVGGRGDLRVTRTAKILLSAPHLHSCKTSADGRRSRRDNKEFLYVTAEFWIMSTVHEPTCPVIWTLFLNLAHYNTTTRTFLTPDDEDNSSFQNTVVKKPKYGRKCQKLQSTGTYIRPL